MLNLLATVMGEKVLSRWPSVHVYYTTEFGQIITVHRKSHKNPNLLKFCYLLFMAFELKTF
jgi:hypothetical protein